MLLEPTEIYVRAVGALLDSGVDVRGLAHITGDGLNNLLRLSREVGYRIDSPLPVPEIFDLIQELGEVPYDEMHEVFNMGLGFVCVVAGEHAHSAVDLLGELHPGSRPIGTITADAGVISR